MDKITAKESNPTYETYADLFGDDSEAVSESFKTSLAFYKERIDALERTAEEAEVAALLRYLGADCSIDLLKKVRSVYEGRLYDIEHNVIPNLFSSEGVQSMDFEDGASVKIEMEYESKTVDKSKAIAWLEATGHGDAVRDTLDFLPGSFDEKALEYLKGNGYSFSMDRTVNGQTLKKIVKDALARGAELPPADAIKFKADKVAIFKYPKERF